jgi:hypothetical protein
VLCHCEDVRGFPTNWEVLLKDGSMEWIIGYHIWLLHIRVLLFVVLSIALSATCPCNPVRDDSPHPVGDSDRQ